MGRPKSKARLQSITSNFHPDHVQVMKRIAEREKRSVANVVRALTEESLERRQAEQMKAA